MKKALLVICAIAIFVLAGCDQATSSYDIEQEQQEVASKELMTNQPPPNLGGWSFERHIVTEVYKARNKTISTYTYLIIQYTGQLVEVCPSVGYPIPYSTQLTNPDRIESWTSQGGYAILPNPEPNGLYPPDNAAATLVNCVNEDGTVTPVYIEDNVLAFPYKLKADRVFEREDGSESSLKLDTVQK